MDKDFKEQLQKDHHEQAIRDQQRNAEQFYQEQRRIDPSFIDLQDLEVLILQYFLIPELK